MRKEIFLTVLIVTCLLLAGNNEPSRNTKQTRTFPLRERNALSLPIHHSEEIKVPAPLREQKRTTLVRKGRGISSIATPHSETGKSAGETALEKTLTLLKGKGSVEARVASDIENYLRSHRVSTMEGFFRPEWKPFTDLYARVLEDQLRDQDAYN